MTNHAAGHAAEERAARYLSRLGFKIRQLNWRTKFCEIDIVAERARTLYFVEVKYRQSRRWSNAVEAVTPKKIKQMHFAAAIWIAQHSWQRNCRLAVLSIDGNIFRLDFL